MEQRSMPQLATHLTDLILFCAHVIDLPGIEPRTLSAYRALSTHLQTRYAIDIASLEDGAITPTQRQTVESALAAITGKPDLELISLLQTVINSLGSGPPVESIGVALADVKARLLAIKDVITSGAGVQLVNSQFDELIQINDIHSATVAAPTSQSSLPPVVTLKDVKAGGSINIGSITQTITQILAGKSTDAQIIRRRKDMLALVEDTWINGILRPSLQSGLQLQLQLATAPDLVANHPFAELVQMPATPQISITPQQDIVELFLQSRQRLLLLGEPGSGKTTLLLLIAQAMIEAARQDDAQPIPIIFNLASWSLSHPSLDSWILAEMKEKYLIPNKLVVPLLANDELMFLLDGLDEVKEVERRACLAAINQFLGEHRVPMVVCCRKTEYSALNERLRLALAIQIQPLTQPQIVAYLQVTQSDPSGLAALLQADTQVRELACTPLGLHIMSVAAANLPAAAWAPGLSSQQWQAQLFNTYLSTMFHRRSGRHPYSPQQTVDWLGWLADQMLTQGQSIFLLEQIQPSLLANRRQRLLYHTAVRALGALLFLSICSFIAVLVVFLGTGKISLLGRAFGFGFVIGALDAIALVLASVLVLWLPNIVAVLLPVGAVAALIQLFSKYSGADAILGALIFGLLGSLPGLFLAGKRPIRPVDRITWSRLRLGLFWAMLGSAALGLLITWMMGTDNGIGFGLMIGLCCLLPVILFGVSGDDQIQPSIVPNQGIHTSFRTAAIMFVITMIASSLIGFVWEVLAKQGMRIGLAFAVLMGVPIGLVVALTAGGAACIQHYVLRAFLGRSGVMPWRLQAFLDYATDRVFLSRIGGGYIFYHRLLMEYLASTKETRNGIK